VPECASCQGNSSHCLSCEKQYLLLDRSCRSHCPEDYYATENRECIHCPAHCGECNQDGLSVRYNGECLAKCPNSTYYDATTNECRDCDMSCQTCSGHQPSSCLSCDTHRRKDASGHCVWFIQCSLRSYMDHNGQCQQCHKLCHRCSGPGKDNCLSCNEPHFLMNNTCVQECSVGYYAEDKDKRVCERCHFSCKSCVGRHSLQCVNCKSGFFKQGSNCVETCSERLKEHTDTNNAILFFIKEHHKLN
uniref:Growth factor receptor domain-containing protein n=1 Tax=Cyclopterus lumpus TaxID=8103 RepID=A0A8C2Z4C6_CYCLU